MSIVLYEMELESAKEMPIGTTNIIKSHSLIKKTYYLSEIFFSLLSVK